MRDVVMVVAFGVALAAAPAAGQQAGQRSFEPIFKGGGIEVYLKMDFDAGANPFINEANGLVALEARPDYVISGRSLHIRRARPGSYFGGRTNRVAVKGTSGLNIAFCVRARNMYAVTLNFYDALKRDNTTPTSPARTPDENWRVVCFAVEDFHHNANPPQIKVPARTMHTSMFFHGWEEKGKSGEYWIDKFIIYRGADTAPPAPPRDLKAKVVQVGQVRLNWTEPQDNAFAVVYSIYRKAAGGNWRKLAESLRPRFTDRPASVGEYTYRVTAADYDNNCSGPSNDVTVKVNPPTVELPPPSVQVKDRLAYAANVRRIHAKGAGKVRHDVFLFAGDSITAADAYTKVLIQWLGRGLPVRRGVGQMKTGYGKAMIRKYLAESRPEFAVIMYGTNDAKSPAAVEQGVQNLAAVVDACVEFGTVPIVATIPPRGYDKDKQDGQVRFNTALVKMCRARKVPISYCFEEMMQRDLRQMLFDGVHLRPRTGNDAAGAALFKTMRQVYFALRDTSENWK